MKLLLVLVALASTAIDAFDATCPQLLRRQNRWSAATGMLKATVAQRRRRDHRAELAKLLGLYLDSSVTQPRETELVVAAQPDRGGTKLIFLNPTGVQLGHILLESPDVSRSRLRGMCVEEGSRGKGYSRLFIAIWLRLCKHTGVVPATSRINKPLLALTLVRSGFTPTHSEEECEVMGASPATPIPDCSRALSVEVSSGGGEGNHVHLYSEDNGRLASGFSATELRTQRLVITANPSEPRGRRVDIRTQYRAPPGGLADGGSAMSRRLRLSATQDAFAAPLTEDASDSVFRALTGRVSR